MPAQSDGFVEPADAVRLDAPSDTAGLFTCPTGMKRIPAGPFVMGSDAIDTGARLDEQPEHEVQLDEYCMDVTEVTNAAYRACVTAGSCTPPAYAGSDTHTTYYGDAAFDSYPVIWVTWMQASAYCMWASKRLPTEAQWEKAARGGCELVAPVSCGSEDERVYPWGEDTPTCALANAYLVAGTGCAPDTDAVGSHPTGNSPYGLADMAGNVMEWVNDWHSSSYYATCGTSCSNPQGPTTGNNRGVRGGSFHFEFDADMLRASRRVYLTPTGHDPDLGFRCVR